MSTEKYVCSVCVFLFMATMLLCGSCQLRSMCVVCVSLCGDHAFVRVMSTEKYVYSVCVFLFMATMLLCGSCRLRSICVVCVSLCGDHAFVRVMSTEKYVCSVCVFLFMATMLLCGSCQLRSMCVVCVSLCGGGGDKNISAGLIDFGKATKLSNAKLYTLSELDQADYMSCPENFYLAPEVLSGESRQARYSDMFAIGGVFYKILDAKRLTNYPDYGKKLCQFAERCRCIHYSRRPDAKQALKFFEELLT